MQQFSLKIGKVFKKAQNLDIFDWIQKEYGNVIMKILKDFENLINSDFEFFSVTQIQNLATILTKLKTQ